jgi:OmpA-OmpF porin, OOP family
VTNIEEETNMDTNKLPMKKITVLACLALLMFTSSLVAQNITIRPGQKVKFAGTVVRRDVNTFTVRDYTGVDIVVNMSDNIRISEKKGNPFRSSKKYVPANILRGLNVEIEGRMDNAGRVVAEKVKFSDEEFRVARSIESRVVPVEQRVTTNEVKISNVEQNARRLSGQLEELSAVANVAKGGARAAQEAADFAVASINATNERIVALDDYIPQDLMTIKFRRGSDQLSIEGKRLLDDLAKKAIASKGYMIEVTGFADATGNEEYNRQLSQRRADAVVRYLAEDHRIPLRRIITPFGYGESQSIADNTTNSGRAANRRVEVKLLINRGLHQEIRANLPQRQ